MSRALSLQHRLAAEARAAQQTQLTITLQRAQHLRLPTATNQPTNTPSRPSSASGSGPSASSASTTAAVPGGSAPAPIKSYLAFNQFDEQRTLVESQPIAGENPEYSVSSTVPLTVNELLLSEFASSPLVIDVYQIADEVAPVQSTINSSGANSSRGVTSPNKAAANLSPLNLHIDEKDDGANGLSSPETKRPLIGRVSIPLAALIGGQRTIQGSFPIQPPTPVSINPNYFFPDPDLGLPELFVPYGFHQSQRPATPAEGKSSARGSAPSTPENRRAGSISKKDKEKQSMEVPVESIPSTPAAPLPPMELGVSIELSRPLLNAEQQSASTCIELSIDRVSSLPARWLQDWNELETDKEKVRAEADTQIQAWKKKGAKKAKPAPADKAAPKTPVNDKKREKERQREMELKSISDRLNSAYRFGVSLDLPLGNGFTFEIRSQCEQLELPPPSPPASPQIEKIHPSELDALSPRDALASPPSAPSSARKSSVGGLGGGPSGSPGKPPPSGGKDAAANKAKRKADEEKAAKEAAEAAEIAAQKFATRMANRFIPFRIEKSIFLTSAGVSQLTSLIQSASTVPVSVWRELISVDPANAGAVLQRDELSASANLDLKSLLKPGAVNLAVDASLKLNAQVMANLEAAAAAAREKEAAEAADAAAAAASPTEDRADRRRTMTTGGASLAGSSSSAKKSARKEKQSKEEIAVPSASAPPVDPFLTAHSNISIKLHLTAPLVPVVIKPILSLSDIIPPRKVPAQPRPTSDVELSEELTAFVKQLALEYQAIATQVIQQQQEERGNTDPLADAELQQQTDQITAALLYRLNSSGMYHSLKERLKPVIVKLHRQGRKREVPSAASSTEVTFDRRVGRLYAEMVDRLHVTLNEIFHPSRYSKPTTVPFVPALPEKQYILPDTPYEDSVNPEGAATELRSALHYQLQAEIGSEGEDAPQRLAVLAQEAELQGDYPRAAALYQARCLLEYQAKSNLALSETSKFWYDFACFQLRLKNVNAASQCLRQSLSIDPTNQSSIVALAALSIDDRRDLDEAEVLLRTYEENQYANHEQQFLLLRALYAEAIDEPEQAEEAWSRLHASHSASLAPPPAAAAAPADASGSTTVAALSLPTASSDPATATTAPAIPGTAPTTLLSVPEDFKLAPKPASDAPESLFVHASRYLISLGLTELAQSLLQRDSSDSPFKAIQLGRLDFTRLGVGPFDVRNEAQVALASSAMSHLDHAIKVGVDWGQVIEAFALRGHLYYQQGRLAEAFVNYETYQDWEPSSLDPLLLYRLGVLYTLNANQSASRECFLQLSSVSPSAMSWLGVAESSMALGDQTSAEQALIQSNRLDKSHPTVWARLSIVSLLHHRVELAHVALLQAIKLQCTQHELFREIGNLYLSKGFVDLARGAFERSLSLRDSPLIRLDLSHVYLALRQFELAEKALLRAREIADDDSTHAVVQEKWEQLEKQLGRPLSEEAAAASNELSQGPPPADSSEDAETVSF